MRIQHNITALNAHRNLTNNNSSVGKNLEKLSSGYKINRAGDDAAGLAISEKMRAQITGLETAQKNANDGVSLVQTAEGALTEVHSMLNRMVELSTQSANGTYSSTNRAEMQKEIVALRKEIDRISNTANFNGTSLFNNGTQGIAIHAGETSKTANQITITLKAMSATSMADSNGNTVSLNTAVDISTATQAQASIDIVNKAIDIISSMRSDFGALQNRLEHTINNLGVQTENLSAAESRIRDVDMAKEMMTYTKNNILVQASQAMLAQANQVPQGVLQLLQ
ncbi:flagellin [Schaedlerella arabinosiphila]|uniref:Flagellin n=1 Tax=Schaedlerella arabinosiphila TaxID=2044587 RepID=A0A426DLU9_9FIRM|nr:flagellin [Schaedlerella arabinosiphila]RRK33708.1 flagellin [Schaedlerella arabinosiphila]